MRRARSNYRIRATGEIKVPYWIRDVFDADARFSPLLTDDGILYVYMGAEGEVRTEQARVAIEEQETRAERGRRLRRLANRHREEQALRRLETERMLSERREEIERLYCEVGLDGEPPLTCEEIGRRFGVTRERIRQILNETTEGSHRERHQEAMAAALEIAEERERKQLGRLAPKAAELWRETGSTEQVASELGVSVETSRRLLELALPRHEWRAAMFEKGRDLARTRRASEEDVIGWLQVAAEELGEPLVRKEYDRLAKERGWTSSQIAMKRFGTWLNALDVAGVRGMAPLRRTYTRITNEELIDSVAKAARELGYIPACQEYDDLSRGRPEMFSQSLLRDRLGDGDWVEVCRAVARRYPELASTPLARSADSA